MQKRIVLVLLVLFAASMSVLAMDQASVAAKLPYFEFNSNQSQTTIIVGGTNNTLFAGVDGSALTDEEMVMVEGAQLPQDSFSETYIGMPLPSLDGKYYTTSLDKLMAAGDWCNENLYIGVDTPFFSIDNEGNWRLRLVFIVIGNK